MVIVVTIGVVGDFLWDHLHLPLPDKDPAHESVSLFCIDNYVAIVFIYNTAIPVQRSNQLNFRGQLLSSNRKFMYIY
jgi:hypothetical protein